MFESFLSSWDLFANAWISSWLIATLLSLLGVAVLARDQVFLGAAMSQAATAGVAIILFIAGCGCPAWVKTTDAILAIVGAVVTALAVGCGRGHRESRTAWIFLACSSAAVLLVAHSPHGMEEVQRLIASSLIGATSSDVWFFSVLLAMCLLVVGFNAAKLKTILLDPAFAAAIGIRVGRWELALAVALGVSLGWSLHVAGMLYTFGALVLPVMAAKQLTRELGTLTMVTPILALVVAVLASIAADAWDYPPAQVAVAGWAGLLMVTAGINWLGECRFFGRDSAEQTP